MDTYETINRLVAQGTGVVLQLSAHDLRCVVGEIMRSEREKMSREAKEAASNARTALWSRDLAISTCMSGICSTNWMGYTGRHCSLWPWVTHTKRQARSWESCRRQSATG